jgi:glutamate synthase (NADPH) small chain
MTLRSSSSHEEGAERVWSVLTKRYVEGKDGHVGGLEIVEIEWKATEEGMSFKEIPGTERILPCDLAFIAIGYTGPAKDGLLEAFGVEIQPNGLPWSKDYQSSNKKVFLAGDMRKGQSLVVWAISEGREAAYHLDTFLEGKSNLPQKDHSFYEHVGEVELGVKRDTRHGQAEFH